MQALVQAQIPGARVAAYLQHVRVEKRLAEAGLERDAPMPVRASGGGCTSH